MFRSTEFDAPTLLKEARSIMQMTQTAFGERLGATRRTVMRWERGTTVATCFHLLHAAGLVEVRAPEQAKQMRAAAYVIAHALGDTLAVETFVSFAELAGLTLAALRRGLG